MSQICKFRTKKLEFTPGHNSFRELHKIIYVNFTAANIRISVRIYHYSSAYLHSYYQKTPGKIPHIRPHTLRFKNCNILYMFQSHTIKEVFHTRRFYTILKDSFFITPIRPKWNLEKSNRRFVQYRTWKENHTVQISWTKFFNPATIHCFNSTSTPHRIWTRACIHQQTNKLSRLASSIIYIHRQSRSKKSSLHTKFISHLTQVQHSKYETHQAVIHSRHLKANATWTVHRIMR